MITLKNAKYVMELSNVGAEIHSLINTQQGNQYIWNGDPAFWGRHTPLLFPVTGPLPDGHIQVQGKSYPMPVNGFARDMPFQVLSHTETEAVFLLSSNEETKAFYPFDFSLQVTHTLLDDGYRSTAQIKANEQLWCTFGWHPAFSLDMNQNGADLSTFVVEFEQEESVDRLYPVNGIFKTEKQFLHHQKTLQLSRTETDKGPIVLNGLRSAWVKLSSTQGKHSVTVQRADMPTLVIWTKEQLHAQFVCVEPMYSFQDAARNPELSKMEGMLHLAAGESRTFSNAFTFN